MKRISLISFIMLISFMCFDFVFAEDQPNTKNVYLTFDDGPNVYTKSILDVLDKYNAKATFFMLSGNIKNNEKIVNRMIKENHAIGLHGVTHNHKIIYKSPQSVVKEMNTCNYVLYRTTGVGTKLIRTPYGSKPYMKQSYRDAIVSEGYKMWDWTIDSGDTKSINITSNEIIINTINGLKNTKYPIVLFHDKKNTLEALPTILTYLNDNGYKYKVLNSELEPFNYWKDIR